MHPNPYWTAEGERKRKQATRRNLLIAGGITAAVAGIAIVAGNLSTATPTVTPGSSSSETPASTRTPTPAPTKPAGSFGPGTHLIGTDVEPGTYRSGEVSRWCYWARLSGTSGEFKDIIANDNLHEGAAIVTISSGDVAFESSGCGTWMMVN